MIHTRSVARTWEEGKWERSEKGNPRTLPAGASGMQEAQMTEAGIVGEPRWLRKPDEGLESRELKRRLISAPGCGESC